MPVYYGEQKQPLEDNKDIPGTKIAEMRGTDTSIPWYRFLVQGSTGTKYQLAGANARVVGVNFPDQLMFDVARETGERTVATGYLPQRPISAFGHGIVPVEVGSGGCSKRQLGKSDADGKAIVYTKPTISASPAQAEVQAVLNRNDIVAGEFLEDGVEGDIVLFDLDKR